jgi:hypothetical protein
LQSILDDLKNFADSNLENISIEFDLQDVGKEDAQFLIFLHQSYQSNPIILTLLPLSIQTALYELHQQSKSYMDILPKIAKGEVTESQIEDYLLKKALEYKRKKQNQWLAQKIEANEI